MKEKGKRCIGGFPLREDPSQERREGWGEKRLWVQSGGRTQARAGWGGAGDTGGGEGKRQRETERDKTEKEKDREGGRQ